MQRTPEPELMDGQDQALAYAAADFSAGDQALVDRLQTLFPQGLGASVVDLGCGPGNISFRLAEQLATSMVLGLDGAAAMLDLARVALAKRPHLATRLHFQQVVFPDAQLMGGHSAVVSNSLLHHLHDPSVLWQTVLQLGSSNAAVYVKDLRRPSSADEVEDLRSRYLADAPAVLQHDYVASLHAAFTPAEVERQLGQAGLADQLQVQAVEDRYLEVWGHLL